MTKNTLIKLVAFVASVAVVGSLAATPAQAMPDPSAGDASNAMRYDTSDGIHPYGDIIEDLSDEDDEYERVELPFPVNFLGHRAAALCISTNAAVYPIEDMDSSCDDDYNNSVDYLAADAEANVIAVLAADQDLDWDMYGDYDGVGEPGNVYFGTTTIGGKEAVVVTYYKVKMYDDENSEDLFNNFQIVMIKDGTGSDEAGYDFTIEFNYGTITDNEEGYSAAEQGMGSCDNTDLNEDCRWGVGMGRYAGKGEPVTLDSGTFTQSIRGYQYTFDLTLDSQPELIIGEDYPVHNSYWNSDNRFRLVSMTGNVYRFYYEGRELNVEERTSFNYVDLDTDAMVTNIAEVSAIAPDPDYSVDRNDTVITLTLNTETAHGLSAGDLVEIDHNSDYDPNLDSLGGWWRVNRVISPTAIKIIKVTYLDVSTRQLPTGDIAGDWYLQKFLVQGYELFANAGINELVDGGSKALISHSMNSDVMGRYSYSVVNGEVTNWDEVWEKPFVVEAPEAPRNVNAQLANQKTFYLSWDAPAYDGGAEIEGYTVTSTPAGFDCTTTTATSCIFNGMTVGVDYTFTVVASNSVGDSEAGVSNSIKIPTPVVAPKPVQLTVLFESGSSKLTAKAKLTLKKWLAEAKGAKTIYLAGHTEISKKTSQAALKALGLARAKSVRDFYRSLGLQKIYVLTSFGSTKPVSDTNQALNRRVRISFVK